LFLAVDVAVAIPATARFSPAAADRQRWPAMQPATANTRGQHGQVFGPGWDADGDGNGPGNRPTMLAK